MGEYFGLFVFLGVFLGAFWILIFLASFVGYWASMGALSRIMPNLFKSNEEEIRKEMEI